MGQEVFLVKRISNMFHESKVKITLKPIIYVVIFDKVDHKAV